MSVDKIMPEDIKRGGWIRYNVHSNNYDELAKVRDFNYDESCANGYFFGLYGQGAGWCFERSDFKYSDNASDLVEEGETVFDCGEYYFIGEVLTKKELKHKEVSNE